jgi:hypothetical protein
MRNVDGESVLVAFFGVVCTAMLLGYFGVRFRAAGIALAWSRLLSVVVLVSLATYPALLATGYVSRGSWLATAQGAMLTTVLAGLLTFFMMGMAYDSRAGVLGRLSRWVLHWRVAQPRDESCSGPENDRA